MLKTQEHTPKRGRLLYEGHWKRVRESGDPAHLLLEFKAEFPDRDAPNSKKGQLTKPKAAALVAEHVFNYLQSFRIPSHFVSKPFDDALLVRRMTMVPVAIIVRSIAAGSLSERYGVPEGTDLEFPIVELIYRNSKFDYPLVNESHLLAFGVCTGEEIRTMIRIATKTNAVLRAFMERRRFRLVDLWLEFGRCDGEILIGDAITPDTMRILDLQHQNAIHDGSRFRLGVGDHTDTYLDLTHRLTT